MPPPAPPAAPPEPPFSPLLPPVLAPPLPPAAPPEPPEVEPPEPPDGFIAPPVPLLPPVVAGAPPVGVPLEPPVSSSPPLPPLPLPLGAGELQDRPRTTNRDRNGTLLTLAPLGRGDGSLGRHRARHGQEPLLFRIDLDGEVLVAHLGEAGVNLQSDHCFLATTGLFVYREFVPVDAHAHGAGGRVGQDLELIPGVLLHLHAHPDVRPGADLAAAAVVPDAPGRRHEHDAAAVAGARLAAPDADAEVVLGHEHVGLARD